jgi:diguanylate cyclase (GGDEF)-like protein/PAS domain S-box-containing protein
MSDSAVQLSALRGLYVLIGQLNAGRSLAQTLQSVVDGVVDGLGFGVAAVNYVHADGTFETVAVSGSDEAREQLLGSRVPANAFDAEFAVAECWGSLRFVPHDRLPDGAGGWVPPAEFCMSDEPDAWHPLDALFVPLLCPAGTLVGMLSVDLPHDGRRPGPLQQELLSMFATQAGIAIDNARLTEQLNVSEQSFRLAFEGAGIGMTMISLDPADPGRFLRVNEAMCRITGYSAQELTSRTYADITHPEDRGPDGAAFAEALTGGELEVYRAEKRYVRRDGSLVWVAITTTVVRNGSGDLLHGITQVEDITARHAAEQELRHRAAHDPLTGLANRATLMTRLHEAVTTDDAGATAGAGAAGTLLFCDLDGFKSVNDSFGHDVGDEVLRVVAQRLTDQVRARDTTVARLGGDEFVVLAIGLNVEDAERIADQIRQAIAEPIPVGPLTILSTVSIGLTPLRGRDAVRLVKDADGAMYRAKAAGKNCRSTVRGILLD